MTQEEMKQRLLDRINLKNSYDAVFCNKDGERVIRHLMKTCGLLKPSIITDTNLLLVRQGQQHIVLSILRAINKSQDELINQIEESIANENT